MEGWAEQILKLSWKSAKNVVGIITGHGTLRKHRHTKGLITDPACRFCEKEDETSMHVILECPALVERRRLYLGDPFSLANNIEVKDARRILQFYEKVMGWIHPKTEGRQGISHASGGHVKRAPTLFSNNNNNNIITSTFCLVCWKSLSNKTSFDLFPLCPMLSFKFLLLAVRVIFVNAVESRLQLPWKDSKINCFKVLHCARFI